MGPDNEKLFNAALQQSFEYGRLLRLGGVRINGNTLIIEGIDDMPSVHVEESDARRCPNKVIKIINCVFDGFRRAGRKRLRICW